MNEELLEIIIPLDLKYKWSAGPHLGAFLRGLKEEKIIANRCPVCARLQLPPTPACGRCHIGMGEDWVELSHQGSVISYSSVVDPMFDAGIGGMRPVPYTIAAIVLDGGPDVAFFHKLEENNPEKVKVGMRVEAVFRPPEERKALMEDIIHFRTIG
ncbi:MAG: Zn-ribbon domain-containing OB-fold protein [Desulfobacteraceae bacterium]|nr:Zn-ribbon domain-containing OB-fold protein [Desulfobacteraceae bacterium]